MTGIDREAHPQLYLAAALLFQTYEERVVDGRTEWLCTICGWGLTLGDNERSLVPRAQALTRLSKHLERYMEL